MKRSEANLLDFKAKTLSYLTKIHQISQSECKTRIYGALGDILVDIGFPEDATFYTILGGIVQTQAIALFNKLNII